MSQLKEVLNGLSISPDEQALIDALKDAEKEHHIYETTTLEGKRDGEWCKWYAEYLLKTHSSLFVGDSPALVAMGLKLATDAHVFHKEVPWEEFTANYFLNHF